MCQVSSNTTHYAQGGLSSRIDVKSTEFFLRLRMNNRVFRIYGATARIPASRWLSVDCQSQSSEWSEFAYR